MAACGTNPPASASARAGALIPEVRKLRLITVFSPSPAATRRQNLDVSAYAAEIALSLRPLIVVQTDGAAQAADGLQRQWLPAVLDVSKHHGYAAQWFALSALVTGLYVWFQLIRPRRRPPL